MHCIHCVHIPQLLTVVPSLFLTVKSAHLLEPPSRTQSPTLVMMAALSMEHQIEPVKLVETGTLLHLPVIVSAFKRNKNYSYMYISLAVDCGPLNNTANGQVSTSSGTTFMMTATYTCNPGYALSSTDSRMCGASAVWSGDAPVCNCKSN